METVKSINLVLIRPSQYDDEGFVIRYFRGVLPSNTLACMRSLTYEFSGRWEKESGITIKTEEYDESVSVIPFKKIARRNKNQNKVVVAIVGVQSNQFPRASDIAKRFTNLGIKTLIGGFHVSGIISVFKKVTPEIQELIDMGVTIVHGEAEDRWESILSDVVAEKEKLLYIMSEFPDISDKPVPQPDARYMKKFAIPYIGTVDCSRGCPFNCSFCTVINVQGHKMRYRSAESVLEKIRDNYNRGITEYFFTDDNFSRNPNWEPIIDGLISMNEDEGMDMSFMMQVDTNCNRIRNFVEKAARGGCTQVFIGMESLNPENLIAAGKKQNKVENYESFINDWHNAGIMTHVGYIIGFPYDTPESVRDDIEKLKNKILVDQASFFILTPLPGSMDHYNLVQSGVYIDPDLNKYDSFHTVTEHPRMTREEVFKAYQDAWDSFYDLDNLKKILMRIGRKAYWNVFKNIVWYKNSMLEPRHPMVAGFIRLKNRKNVRPGTRVMGIYEYYMMRVRELIGGFAKRVKFFFDLQELWLITRKPEDPTFKLVADFTAVLNEAKNYFSSIEINESSTKLCEEMQAALTTLKDNIYNLYNSACLTGKTKRRFNTLVDDINANIDKITLGEHYNRSVTFITNYLSNNIRLTEEFFLKHVAMRRKITNFWELTWNRIKRGKILSFVISMPIIFLSAIRDFRMSISFAYHFILKNF